LACWPGYATAASDMRLILVRHPRPQIAAGICYGRSDLTVSDEALQTCREQLHAALPADIPLFSSPLQRCARLARALDPVGLTLDARLAELDFGCWEMQPWERIARAEIDAWSQNLVHYRPGGGESLLAMAERISAFYADLRQRRLASALIICHAGSIRLLAACLSGLTPEQMARHAAAEAHAIDYGGIVILEGHPA